MIPILNTSSYQTSVGAINIRRPPIDPPKKCNALLGVGKVESELVLSVNNNLLYRKFYILTSI